MVDVAVVHLACKFLFPGTNFKAVDRLVAVATTPPDDGKNVFSQPGIGQFTRARYIQSFLDYC